MAGYWPSSFFACLWTEDGVEVQYPAILTEQAWSISGFRRNHFCGTWRVISVLPARVANQSAGFDLSSRSRS